MNNPIGDKTYQLDLEDCNLVIYPHFHFAMCSTVMELETVNARAQNGLKHHII